MEKLIGKMEVATIMSFPCLASLMWSFSAVSAFTFGLGGGLALFFYGIVSSAKGMELK